MYLSETRFMYIKIKGKYYIYFQDFQQSINDGLASFMVWHILLLKWISQMRI